MKNILNTDLFYLLEYYQYNGKRVDYYDIKKGKKYTFKELLQVLRTIDNNSEDFDIEINDDCIVVIDIRNVDWEEASEYNDFNEYCIQNDIPIETFYNICDVFNKTDLTEARVYSDPDNEL